MNLLRIIENVVKNTCIKYKKICIYMFNTRFECLRFQKCEFYQNFNTCTNHGYTISLKKLEKPSIAQRLYYFFY